MQNTCGILLPTVMNLCVGGPPVHPAPEWYPVVGTALLLSRLLYPPVALL